ncbi:MAG: hypothetical protein WA821_02285 [Anaerolineales bacterium]
MKVNKNVLLLVIIIALVLIIAQYHSSEAATYPPILLTVEANSPTMVVPTLSSNELTQSQQNADDVGKMIAAWKAPRTKTGLWVHTVDYQTSEEGNGVILPDGQPMPTSYTNDDWFYVNQDGLVVKNVGSSKDAQGKVFQQAAYQNGVTINFTFDMREEGHSPSFLKLDGGFADEVNDALKSGRPIKKSQELINGKPGVAFSYTEKYEKPVVLGNQKVPVSSATTKGYFDASGNFTGIEITYLLANGKTSLYQRVEFVSIDFFPQAPQEILDILERVK